MIRTANHKKAPQAKALDGTGSQEAEQVPAGLRDQPLEAPGATAKYRVVETFKTVEKRNPVSGHEWTEQRGSTGFIIRGPRGPVLNEDGLPKRFRSEKQAEKECAEYEAFEARHPFTPPATEGPRPWDIPDALFSGNAQRAGWLSWHTGGGCYALRMDASPKADSFHLLITSLDGATIPSEAGEMSMLGLYDADGQSVLGDCVLFYGPAQDCLVEGRATIDRLLALQASGSTNKATASVLGKELPLRGWKHIAAIETLQLP